MRLLKSKLAPTVSHGSSSSAAALHLGSRAEADDSRRMPLVAGASEGDESSEPTRPASPLHLQSRNRQRQRPEQQRQQTVTGTAGAWSASADVNAGVDNNATGRSPSPTTSAPQGAVQQRDQPAMEDGGHDDGYYRHGAATRTAGSGLLAGARWSPSVWSGNDTNEGEEQLANSEVPSGGDYTRHEQIVRENDLSRAVEFDHRSVGRSTGAGAGAKRTRSLQSMRSNASSADFDENYDWTPQDSAYGAACPVFGWIPKNVRRIIELTIIVLILFMLVFLVVTTSMRLQNEHSSNGNNNSNNNGGGSSSSSSSAASGGGGSNNGDDYYVDDMDNAVDDDDYFESGEDREDEDGSSSGDEEEEDKEDGDNKRHARVLRWTSSLVADSTPYNEDLKASATGQTRLRRRVGKTLLW